MTITQEQQDKISTLLDHCHLLSGLGSGPEEACSIAAINLALNGTLTDSIPDCMSEVIGRWIIVIQDAMPDSMRNSDEWKSLLPLAAGTGKDKELERQNICIQWMWECLTIIQPVADKGGYGKEWLAMTTKKTANAADAAADAATYAARVAVDATDAAANAANAADAAADAATYDAAYADAVAAAAATAAVDDSNDYWKKVNPIELLQKLIDCK